MECDRNFILKSISALLILLLATTNVYCRGSVYEMVNVGGKWGIRDVETQVYLVEPTFDGITSDREGGRFISFYFGLIPVMIGNKWGYVDNRGTISIDCIYDSASIFKQYGQNNVRLGRGRPGIVFAEVRLNNKIGVIDQRGRYYLDPDFDSTESPTQEEFKAMNEQPGIKYKNNSKVVLLGLFDGRISESTSSTSSDINLKPVRVNGKYGFVDKNDRMIIPASFQKAMDYFEGLAAVKYSDKWGFVDDKGNIVVDCKFEDVNNFANGYARVKMDNKWGYIDKSGKYIVEPIFNYCWDFSVGKAKVRMDDGSIRYIDKSGKYIE